MSMKIRNAFFRWIVGITFIVPLISSPGAAFKPPQDPPRYLFIVEKSDHTQAARINLPQTMFDLVYHGANGNLPDGGVFEIWVFGEQTIYRGFEPEMLTPRSHLMLGSKASAYVKTANCGGPPDIVQMAEHMQGAGDLAIELTVVLVTAPETRLTGTKIDSEVNAIYEQKAAAQAEAGRPFITSIRFQDGKIVGWQISDSPFTMTMPPMPVSPLPIGERERIVAEARQAHFEKERAAAEAAKPKPAPITTKTARDDTPDDARDGAIILRGTPNKPPTEESTKPAEKKLEETPAATAETSNTETKSETTKVAPVTPLPAAESNNDKTTVASTTETSTEKPVAKSDNQVDTKPPSVETVSAPTPKPPAPEPVDQPVKESTNVEKSSTAASNPPVAVAKAPTPQKVSPTNAPPQAATSLAPQTWFTVGGLFVAGLCFFVVAALLAWVLMRRTRSTSGPSYITRSIDDRHD